MHKWYVALVPLSNLIACPAPLLICYPNLLFLKVTELFPFSLSLFLLLFWNLSLSWRFLWHCQISPPTSAKPIALCHITLWNVISSLIVFIEYKLQESRDLCHSFVAILSQFWDKCAILNGFSKIFFWKIKYVFPLSHSYSNEGWSSLHPRVNSRIKLKLFQ